MYLSKQVFTNIPEFLKSEKYQNISCTVDDTSVAADERGKKFVFAGTLLDIDGKAIKITRSGSAGSYTYALSADPAGILFRTIEVTHGPQAGALMIDGSVNVERLQGNYIAEALPQILPKLPYIKFFAEDKLQIQ